MDRLRHTDTAHLLPRLIDGRTSGPLFLSSHKPGPHRLATTDARDIDPETGRAIGALSVDFGFV